MGKNKSAVKADGLLAQSGQFRIMKSGKFCQIHDLVTGQWLEMPLDAIKALSVALQVVLSEEFGQSRT